MINLLKKVESEKECQDIYLLYGANIFQLWDTGPITGIVSDALVSLQSSCFC